MADAFGRALLEHFRDERTDDLRQRDGDEVLIHPIEDYYFGSFEDEPGADWLRSQLDGPLLDIGAGSGRDSLYFQQHYETVALEISNNLRTLLQEREVHTVSQGDMFALPSLFERDRFQSALVLGTQLGMAGSMLGLREFFGDLAHITTADATAVVDGYDPTFEGADGMLGFRADPTPGLAHRVLRYEYDGSIGDTLCFRLVSPDKLRAATTGTGWSVSDINRPHSAYYYQAALAKQAPV